MPDRPRFHIRPDAGWLNDPHGLAFLDGTYHVFFQYNPHAPVHDRIHWGHVTSPDLLTWTQQPVALVPRPHGPDAGGCWTGCLVPDGPVIAYTACDAGGQATTVLAHPTDPTDPALSTWRAEDTPVVGPVRLPGVTDVRDPFVFSAHGHRWAVQGAGSDTGGASVLVWQVDDLHRWDFRGTLVDVGDPVLGAVAPSQVWECPNLVRIGDDWVLLVCDLRHDGSHQMLGAVWAVGDVLADGDGLRFVARTAGRLDEGTSLYAPQVLDDRAHDRVLLIGWARELGLDDAAVAAQGWQGVLTLPRVLTVTDDTLVVSFAAELTRLRGREVETLDGLDAFDLVADSEATLLLDGVAVVDLRPGDRVIVDGSVVEVTGSRSVTTRAYPGATGRWSVTGHVRAWDLRLP